MNAYYYYEGPVMVFDKCVASKWQATTFATSEQKAKNNMIYQYKQRNNLSPNTKVSLPGSVQRSIAIG